MSFDEEIDFTKYGLNWKLSPDMKAMPASFIENVSQVVQVDATTIVFTKPTGEKEEVKLVEKLGSGSFGTTWSTADKPSRAVKILDDVNDLYERYDIVQECLAQIIIYEATKDIKVPELNLSGPFCPKFYLLGRSANSMYIVMEKLEYNMNHMLKIPKNPKNLNAWKQPSSVFIKESTLQLCKILKILYAKIGYNHRDLKPDNVMFNMIGDKINMRLIDFGFSCLKYRNTFLKPLNAKSFSSSLVHCDSETRDIHSYFYSLLEHTFYSSIECPIKAVINTLSASSQASVALWPQTYLEFDKKNANTSKIRPLNLSLDVVNKVFNKLSFVNTESCSEINPEWASEIVKIYPETLCFLNTAELGFVKPELIKTLLQNVNDVDTEQHTALMFAADKGNLPLVKLLLSSPKILTARKDTDGNTALHYAVLYYNLEWPPSKDFPIVKLLIEANPALPDIKDNSGRGPGNRAYTFRIPEVRKYIKSRKSPFIGTRKINTNKTKGGKKSNRRKTRSLK